MPIVNRVLVTWKFGVRRFTTFTLIALFALASTSFSDLADAAEFGADVTSIQSTGKGGTQVKDLCPNGFVLTEVSANPLEWNGYETISKISGSCTQVDSDGKSLGNEASVTPRRGNFRSTNFKNTSCPNDSVAVGAEVFKTLGPGFYVAGLTLKCGKLPNGESVGNSALLGYATDTSEKIDCPAKSVAMGLTIRYGDIVDAFGLLCSTIIGVSQGPITSVSLNPVTKTYPYETDLQVEKIMGGSGDGKATIVSASDGTENLNCRLVGKRLTAEKPGRCILVIQKSGDTNFKSARFTTNFEFKKLPVELDIESLGVLSKKYPYSQQLNITLKRNDVANQVLFIVSDGTAKNCQLSDTSTFASLTASTFGTCLIRASFKEDSNFIAREIEPTVFTFEKANLNVLAPTYRSDELPTSIIPSFSGFVEGENENSENFKEDFLSPTCIVDASNKTSEALITCTGGEARNYTFTYIPGKLLLSPTNEIERRSDLLAYDPLSEPEKTVDLQVAAFALLTIAAGAGALSRSSQNQDNRNAQDGRREEKENNGDQSDKDSERESGDIASADSGKLTFHKKSSSWGDNSNIWKFAYQENFDNRFKVWSENVSSFSPVGSRVILDGSYLRAMLSSVAFLPSLAAIFLAALMLRATDFQALPATFTLLAIAIALSILDSLAGLVMSVILISGVLFAGNVTSLDEGMTLIGLSALLLAPGLLVSSIRPLRRLVSDGESLWERVTDYFLGVLLGGWAIEKLIGALNGLAGVQLPITLHARDLGLIASTVIFVRFLLEDIAVHAFPARLEAQSAELKHPNSLQPWFSLIIKSTIFFLVAYQFLGLTTQLVLGTFIFALPTIVKNISNGRDLPKSKFIHRILPKGAMKVVIMVFVGALFAEYVKRLFSSPADFVSWSFVVLAIPGLVLSIAALFASSPESDWKAHKIGRFIYRFGGMLVALLIIAMYQGIDLYNFVQSMLQNIDLSNLFN